jgi:hypothetical protein
VRPARREVAVEAEGILGGARASRMGVGSAAASAVEARVKAKYFMVDKK